MIPSSLTREQLFAVVSAGAVFTLILTAAVDTGMRIAKRLGFM